MRRLLTAAEEEAASWRLRSSQDQSLADLRDSELRKKSAAVRTTHSSLPLFIIFFTQTLLSCLGHSREVGSRDADVTKR
jgi:hypothetical protein